MIFRAGVSALILAAGHSSRMGGTPKALLPLGGSSLLGMAVSARREGGVEDIRVVTGAHAEGVSAHAEAHGVTVAHNAEFEQGMFSSVRAGLAALDTGSAAGTRAVLLLPVDAALVKPQSVAALIAAWNSLPDAGREWTVLVPSFGGRLGHPPLFGAAHIPGMLSANPEGGLRAWFAGLLAGEEAKSFMRGLAGRTVASFRDAEWPADGTQDLHSCLPDTPFYLVRAATATRDRALYFAPLPDTGVVCDIDTPDEYAEARAFLETTENRARPSFAEAEEWLCNAHLSERKIRHSIQVALGALRLGVALCKAGLPADPELHACGGLLHDIARRHREHAKIAHAWIRAFGWQECALAVGAHTVLPDSLLDALHIPLRDLPLNSRGELLSGMAIPEGYNAPAPQLLLACVCVFLADKHFSGATLVSLPERFAAVLEHFSGNAKAREAIRRREAVALAVRDAVSRNAGRPVEDILRFSCGHELETALIRFSVKAGV